MPVYPHLCNHTLHKLIPSKEFEIHQDDSIVHNPKKYKICVVDNQDVYVICTSDAENTTLLIKRTTSFTFWFSLESRCWHFLFQQKLKHVTLQQIRIIGTFGCTCHFFPSAAFQFVRVPAKCWYKCLLPPFIGF